MAHYLLNPKILRYPTNCMADDRVHELTENKIQFVIVSLVMIIDYCFLINLIQQK